MTLVSIVTIVKDHAAGLQDTFDSLAEQDYVDWEMLIVVGKSIDSTKVLARKYATSDARIVAIEQSGLGLFQAMNQGIDNAKGDYIWFMNAGDKFADSHVLRMAVEEISKMQVGVVIGGYRIGSPVEGKTYSNSKKSISDFTFAFSRRGGCHQAMIFRTSIVKELGGYDTSYSLNSDFDLVLKVIRKCGATGIPLTLAEVEAGGIADQNIFKVHREKHKIRGTYFGVANPIILLSWAWTLAARTKIILRRNVRPDHR